METAPNDGQQEEGQAHPTSDERMLRGREWTTNILAALIVGVTLFAAIYGFHFVGGEKKMEDAKAILAALTGLSGVVIGYYFGRGPAEASASRSHQQMTAMMSEMKKLGSLTPFYAVHLKAGFREQVAQQLLSHRLANLEIAKFGVAYEF